MKIYRNSPLAKLHVLITQKSVDKEVLYSAYGVESAKNLSNDQIKECITNLEGETPKPTKAIPVTDIKKLRSEILALLTKPSPKGLNIPNDWAVLNPFIAQHGGRDLPSMTIADLNRFKLKLHAMKKSGWHYQKNAPEPIPKIVGRVQSSLLS